MLDAYMDCPWREQAQWWGDARVQGKNTFYLSADARLFRRGVLQIGQMNVPNGLTYAHAPTIAHGCVLPDFTLTWVVTHHDYWYQTADLSLFRQMRQRVHEALAYFAERTAANGLLPFDPRYWLFLDWTGLFKEGYSTVYNLFYLLALERAAEMFTRIGQRKDAAVYSARAKALRRSIVTRLFDPRSGSFYGGLDWKDKPVAQDSPHAYALAILTDLLSEHHERFVAGQLLPFVAGDHTGPTAAGPFFSFYIFEALKKCRRGAAVIGCIDRWWGKMVDRGLSTTEEHWDVTAGASSLCHAWSAHPIVHLSNVLLGVWQDAPGWKKIIFRPEFTLVDFAEGKVATPLGAVSSSWHRKGDKIDVRLRLPKGMTARAELPGRKAAKITGSVRWTISAPAE
jgi:alpha-L-rhamnosidase